MPPHRRPCSERRGARSSTLGNADAVGFYRACGRPDVERVVTSKEQVAGTVLTGTIAPR